MNAVGRAISAELLKLRRTLALRVAVGAPVLIVSMTFGMYVQRGAAPGPGVLVGFAQLNLTLWTILVVPFYVALTAALLAGIEHHSDNWKHLFVMPIERRALFVAKWAACIGLLFLSSAILIIAVSAAAETLRIVRPEWRDAVRPIGVVATRAMQSFLAAQLMISIQLWVSLRWRSFIGGLSLAVAAVVMMLTLVPRGAVLVANVFPWSLAATAMAPNSPHRGVAIAWGTLGGIVLAGIASWDLARHEFRST
jgi:hypothetical protein